VCGALFGWEGSINSNEENNEDNERIVFVCKNCWNEDHELWAKYCHNCGSELA
jgi:Zn finger protein HypA/HybF involved in hydrogenase expression